jgi:hypothetical protein
MLQLAAVIITRSQRDVALARQSLLEMRLPGAFES